MKVIQHSYQPRGTALELFHAREPEVLLSGPVGTGKTRACLEKIHIMMLLNPGARGLIARKTAVSLTSTALVTFKEHVAKESIYVGDTTWYGGSSQEPAQYRYSNGSVLVVGGLDKSSRIMSSDYDVIFIPEATELTKDDWEVLKTRLRNNVISFQQIIGDANPSHPTHWLKERCDSGQCRIMNSSLKENPRFYTDDGTFTPAGKAYMDNLSGLSGVRKLRLIDGLWVAAEGVIYEGFDPAVHLIDKKLPHRDWPRYWAIDFGFTNPFVLQCWAEDPDGRLILYREIYRTQETIDVHAADIMRIVAPKDKWREPRPSFVVCDHDAGDRAMFTKVTGLKTIAAKKNVEVGIQAVQRRFKIRADGTPSIMLQRDVVIRRDQSLVERKLPASTAEETPGYVWDKGSKEGNQKETPLKENDHGQDAMRYLVMAKDHRNAVGARFVE